MARSGNTPFERSLQTTIINRLNAAPHTLVRCRVSEESTWRSRLKSLVKSLPDSSTRDSMNGQQQAQRASGQTQGKRYLPSKRKYWPGEAKDVFWDLVRALNKYDKEHAPGGTKSPIQLDVAEEATRRWWEMEHGYRLSP
jgi:hypothetical protein